MNNFWTIAPTRERCENCGRFVTQRQLWHSKELGHSVCDHCRDDKRDGHMGINWLTDSADAVESTPMDNYADYFEDIQNNGPYNFYYCDD